MRIISQKGIDLPYDKFMIVPKGMRIIAISVFNGNYSEDLGIYETEERTLEVMEGIRRHADSLYDDKLRAIYNVDNEEALSYHFSYYQMPKE